MARQMFLLFSHELTPAQKRDAVNSLHVEKFVTLPKHLQELWSNIPADLLDLEEYLSPLREHIKQNAKRDDIVLIQGDFAGVYKMVSFVKSLDLKAVHSTTKREVNEVMVRDMVKKISIFKHICFREY